MHAIRILQCCLSPLLKHIHARRLATLLEAVASCVNGPALSLTDVGRLFAGAREVAASQDQACGPTAGQPASAASRARRARAIAAGGLHAVRNVGTEQAGATLSPTHANRD